MEAYAIEGRYIIKGREVSLSEFEKYIKAWNARQDARIMQLAKDYASPVTVKMLSAVLSESIEEAYTLLDEDFKVRQSVYFMADDFEGEGFVYAVDSFKRIAKVQGINKTRYTVDFGLMTKLVK